MFLNCHTYHSLRYGTIPVEKLVADAKKFGIDALALTDVNTITGVYDFMSECKKVDIKPVVGIDFRNGSRQMYVGLVKNREGFRELNELVTWSNMMNKPFPELAPVMDHVFIIYPFGKEPQVLKDYEYIGININQVNRLIHPDNRKNIDKFVILHPVTFRNQQEYKLHQLLRAVDLNLLITKLPECEHAAYFEQMGPPDRLLPYFEKYPQIIRNTEMILDECNFEFDFESTKNRQTYTGNRYSDKVLLQKLALDGLAWRYGGNNPAAKRRVESELEVIDRLNFNAWFLITWDIIRYSKNRGFYHVGRGSGANSIVSYCLGITDICPIELNLYFERFLNPHRTSPPDFDIDWSHKTRDEILDYVFKRYGKDHVAFVGTIGSFKHRSVMRELGKVFGLPKEEIDVLSKSPKDMHQQDSIVARIHRYAAMLEGFPNLRSLHSCGILISDEPLTYFTGLEMPPKGFQTAQFDMYIGEDIGFDKLDILSQRGISHIDECIRIIEDNRGEKVNIQDVDKFKKDPQANASLSTGNTLGCFYIESPAMRGLLRRLKCDNYPVLVAASSVIRPGVAKSGMMHEYIRRHNHPGEFEYIHPVFEHHLGETYGIMVYQEDVIKIAHHFGGIDLGEADILRRAMSGKMRSQDQVEQVKASFFENCRQMGHPDELANEVYRQIESFAGYSFCKAHSASYAVESYQSLFLKTYYPIEFMVAVINNFGGFYRTEVYFSELKRAGAKLHNPCVNKSDWLTKVYGKEVFVGFIHIKSLKSEIGERIPVERMQNGEFVSMEDFIERVPIGIENLQVLIYTGAFRFTGKPKNELILLARRMFQQTEKLKQRTRLFTAARKNYKLPELDRSPFEDSFDELEHLSFPLSHSPFELLEKEPSGGILATEMTSNENRHVKMTGYLISIKDVPTSRGHMNFGTWIDPAGSYFDSTHFPDILRRFPFQGAGCYAIYGRIAVEFEYPMIEVKKLEKLPMIADPRYSEEGHKVVPALPTGKDNNPVPLTRAPYPKRGSVDFGNNK